MKSQLLHHTPVCFGEDYKSNKQAKITTIRSSETNAEIKSISKDGLTLNCDQQTLRTILPPGTCVSPKQPCKLTVSFTLESMITCECDIIYTRRLSKDCFTLELRFHDLCEDHKLEISGFVDQQFKEKERPKSNIEKLDWTRVA